MDNTPKKSKRKYIIISIVIILAIMSAGGIFLYFNKKNSLSKTDIENKKVLDKMKSTQVAPSGLNPSDLTQVNKLIAQGKDKEAKAILDNLKAQSGLQQYDKLDIYSSLSGVCTRLKDIDCMKEVIVFNKETDRVDVYLIIDTARLLKSKDPDQAKQYYAQAKNEIDSQGGRAYVEKQNNKSQVSIDYDEVSNGAL